VAVKGLAQELKPGLEPEMVPKTKLQK